MNAAYKPIDCNFYDYLEQDATLKKTSRIVYLNSLDETCQTKGIIENLYIEEGVEMLRLDNATVIRLDKILKFNHLEAPGHCSL